MRIRNRRSFAIATLAAICAAFAITAPTAIGKTLKYAGPVNQVFVPSQTGYSRTVPSVTLKANFAGKTPTTVDGALIDFIGLYGQPGVYGTCLLDGQPCQSVKEAPQCFFATKTNSYSGLMRVKNKRFSHTFEDSGPGSTYGSNGRGTMTVTGRVTKASVSGTVLLHEDLYPGGEDPHTRICDTGVLTWTASRGGVYPTPKP
jgi:hypothetical protein